MPSLLLRACIAVVACLLANAALAAERTIVVTLFDGFAPAMADATKTPNLDRIRREGSWSRHLVPAFPTLSMTNHTTYATGCWPEHHGIVSNLFYDPKLGRFDDPKTLNAGYADWHTGCEAMWETAEHQGVHAAVFNWVGRWSLRRGKLATYANPVAEWKKLPGDDWVLQQGLKMLADNGPNHPRLIALYFHGPDDFAHWHGTTSPEALAAVRKADMEVGQLMAAIRALPAGREGTLIIGTDHGMMDVGPMINVGRLMNEFDIHARQATDGASAFLYLDKGESADRVANALSVYRDVFTVYRKGHFPAFAHLGNGPRVPDLMLLTHPPYYIVGPEALPKWAAMLGINHFWPAVFTPFTGGLKATHGYDPHIVEMHGIFYAWGAGIAKGRQIPRLDMIDIHPTVMRLLGLEPGKPVDGHVIQTMLAP